MSKYIDGTRIVYFDDSNGNLTIPSTLNAGSLSTGSVRVSSIATQTANISTLTTTTQTGLTASISSLTTNFVSTGQAVISSIVGNNVSSMASHSGAAFVTSLSTPILNVSSVTTPGKLTISSIRNDETVTAGFLHYNLTTNEVVYNAQGGSGGGGTSALVTASTILATESMIAPTQFYAQELYTNAAYDYTQFCKQFTATGPSVVWCDVAVSATGQYMTALDNGATYPAGGYIYSSSNFGSTWSQVASQQGWGQVAMNATGQIQIAAIGLGPYGYNGQIYRSMNYGATWSLLAGSFYTYWGSLSVSASGQYMSGTDNFGGFNTAGYVYTSSDYGITWARLTSIPYVTLGPISVSASGQYQTVTGQGIPLYRSSDYGQTWSSTGTTDRYAGVAVSASGQYQTATSFTFDGGSGSIYVSANYGATWTVYGSTGIIYRQPAISASGRYQAIFVIDSGMYYSSNYGVTWTFIASPNASLYGIAMSAAADYVVVVARDPQQRIYINNSRLLLQNVATNSLATGSLTATTDIVAGRNFFSQNTLNTNVLNLSAFSQSFTLVNNPGTFNYTSAVSATGQYQLVGTTTFLYVSSDFGSTWTQVATDKDWTGVAISGTGNFMYATDSTASTGNLYRSTDYGLTWAVVSSSPGAGSWVFVAISASGQYVLACGPSYYFISSNYGASFNPVENYPCVGHVAMSATGQYMMLRGPSNNLVSSNYGATWTAVSPASDGYAMAISGSGQYQLAQNNATSTMFLSSDYGATFAAVLASPAWSCAIDFTGQYQVVARLPTNIYYSVNYGVTWTIASNYPNPSQTRSVSLSANAQYFLAPNANGPFYLNQHSVWFPAGISTATAQVSSLTTNSIATSGSFFVNSLRSDPTLTTGIVRYNSTSKELIYNEVGGGTSSTISSFQNAYVSSLGVNCNSPRFVLDVNGTGNFISTLTRFASISTANISTTLINSAQIGNLGASSLTASNAALTSITASTDIVAGRNIFSQNTLNTNVLNLSAFAQSFSLVNNSGTLNLTSAVSATGQYQLVGTTSYLYVSSDFGSTWTQVGPDNDDVWSGVAISGNGNYMYATDFTVSTGNLYRSTDYGLTWAVVPSSPGAGTWSFVAISASGQYVLASGPSYYYRSSDYGLTFTQVESYASSGNVAMSATGQYMMLRAPSSNVVSNNYGATWTAISPVTDGYAMAISGTGQYQLAEDTSTTTLYISSDYGATFISALVAGSAFYSCAIDYTGQYQVATQLGVNIYYSIDYGVTWNNVVTNLDSSQFQSVSLSANAQYLLVPLNNGPFYLNRCSVWFPAGISTATAQVSSLTTNSVLFEKPYFSWQTQGTQLANNFVQTSLLSNLNISSGLFTLECYFNPTATNTYWGTIVSLNNGTTNNGNEFRITQRVGADGFGMLFPITSGSADGFSNIGITILPTDSWYHIALVRTSATNLFLYSNGTAILSTTTLNYSQNQNMQLQIFRSPYNDDIGQGYIQSVRFTAGQALYTGNFTPPTQQLTRNSVGTSGAGTASQITGTVAFLGGVTSTFTDVGPFALALTAGTSNTTTNTVPSTFSSIFLTTFGNHLGINCNSPSFTLDVNGSANFNGIVNFDNLPENNVLINSASQQILLSNTASTYMYMQAPGNRIRIGAYSNASPMLFTINESGGNVSIGSSSTTSFALYLLGNMYASGTITSNSDERVKEDIMNADTSMCYSTMQNIELKYFKWKPSFQSNCYIQDSHQLGFIAQDVKKVFPNSVSISPMHGYDDFHAMESGQLNAMHYGATKKLMSVVERQTAQLVEQSTQIAHLLADNSTLTSYIPQLASTLRG